MCVRKKGKGLGAPHFPPLNHSTWVRNKVQTSDQKSSLEKIHCQTFFPPSYTSKSVWWRDSEKALVLYIFYSHVCFQQQQKEQVRTRYQVQNLGQTDFFWRNLLSNMFPPSYASKTVWGEREKASVLHISYHHVCFDHQSSSRIEWWTEWKPQIKQTFFLQAK